MVLKFEPWGDEPQFDWDEYNQTKLWQHGIRDCEAEECFWNAHSVVPHKKYRDRYIIRGITGGGRRLILIVQYKGYNIVRPITGWDH